MKQFEINFAPGLLDQFPEFGDCLRASVYDCQRAFKAVAADLDLSASSLSRKLNENPNDPNDFPARRLPELFLATGDLRPLYWLVEKFLEDEDEKRKRAADELVSLLPKLNAALKVISEKGN